MALLELTFADSGSLGKGRNFECATCPDRIKKLRQCGVDRWDFTAEDNPSVFPIRLHEGGQDYGFCPSKATWPIKDNVLHRFRTLIFAASMQTMLVKGGILQQPSWFIETMTWFKPMYDQVIWTARMRSFVGGGKMKKTNSKGQSSRGSKKWR